MARMIWSILYRAIVYLSLRDTRSGGMLLRITRFSESAVQGTFVSDMIPDIKHRIMTYTSPTR